MNAGTMLSSVRCETVCRNGNTGVVNGVVMPAISIHTSRVADADHGLVGDAPDDAEARTEVVLVQLPGRARLAVLTEVLELLRLQVEDGGLVVHFGRRKVQRVAHAGVDRDRDRTARQSSWTKYSWKCARFRIWSCCRSIENCCTWPSRKLANGVPVLAMPGRSVNRLLKVNEPVGDGGCMTFSRSQRRSAPSLNVCRPFSHVSESAIWVTLVPKSVAVFGGDPSCW